VSQRGPATPTTPRRIETRRCLVCHDLSAIAAVLQDWPGVRSVVLVQSTRQPVRSGRFGPRGAEPAQPSWRYYISSELLDASKGSHKTKRKRMGRSDDYLQRLFGLTPGSVIHARISSDG
jgi:hypothetical protein